MALFSVILVIFAAMLSLEVQAAVRPVRDRCNPNPCLNGGTCSLRPGTYVCVCPSNCGGGHCEDCQSSSRTIACDPNPCKRDCMCHESCQHAGGYYCRSASGFLGKNCTIPVPTLRCEPDVMVLSVSEGFVHEYDLGLRNSYVSISAALGRSPSCEVARAVNGLYEISIPLPFTACGTIMSTNGKQTVFTNQMWFNRRLANAMFDMPIPVAEFQCSYTREYRIVTSLRPVVSSPSLITSRSVIFPTISLCKVPSCPNSCPEKFVVGGGAVYTVGEMIHVTMTLDSGSQVTGVRTMFLSCEESPSTNNVVEIVSAGCGTTSGLPCKISNSASSHIVCVSFQTPRSLGCRDFYIHAELQSCDSRSTENCPDPVRVKKCVNSRRRRSVEVAAMTVGPIAIINGSAGAGTIKVHGMEDGVAELSVDYAKKDSPVVVERLDMILSADPKKKSPSPPQRPRASPVVDPLVLIGVFGALLVLAVVLSVLFVRCRPAAWNKPSS